MRLPYRDGVISQRRGDTRVFRVHVRFQQRDGTEALKLIEILHQVDPLRYLQRPRDKRFVMLVRILNALHDGPHADVRRCNVRRLDDLRSLRA